MSVLSAIFGAEFCKQAKNILYLHKILIRDYTIINIPIHDT